MINFKGAIFDLDGTLLDSMGVWEKIDIDFLAKRNLSVPENYTSEISALSFRKTAEYTIDRFHLKETAEDLMKEWNHMAAYEYSHMITLKPYAKEYLATLKACGIRIGTATSLSGVLAKSALINHGIYNLFDIQCETDEVGKGKDSPDVFLLAAEKLGVVPEECIVFEDLLAGICSAKKAGMKKVFGIYDEYSKEQAEEIQKAADGYYYSFKDAPVPQNVW